MALKFEGKKVVTSDLSFKPDPLLGNLVKCYLKEVKVVENKIEKTKEDGSDNTWEYAGYTVSYLQFTFVQIKKDKNERDRILRHIESVITFVTSEGQKVDDNTIVSLFTQMNDRIVHIHDAFKNDPNYKPLLDLEFDEKGSQKERLENFKKFFLAIEAAFNKGKNDKPIFIDAKGQFAPLYLKVLPDYKTKSFYGIPAFVNKGFVERCFDQAPSIELTPAEKADFELKSKKGKKVAGDAAGSTVTHDDVDPAVADLIS